MTKKPQRPLKPLKPKKPQGPKNSDPGLSDDSTINYAVFESSREELGSQDLIEDDKPAVK